jgi:hypothetical protein
MFLRPKPGIFTNALKNHLKWGAFSEFMHNPYPLYLAHDTPSLKIKIFTPLLPKNTAAPSPFLSSPPFLPPLGFASLSPSSLSFFPFLSSPLAHERPVDL